MLLPFIISSQQHIHLYDQPNTNHSTINRVHSKTFEIIFSYNRLNPILVFLETFFEENVVSYHTKYNLQKFLDSHQNLGKPRQIVSDDPQKYHFKL